jgi:hypothetical protein
MEKIYQFRLAEKEFEFLRQLSLSDRWLADLLSSHADAHDNLTVIRLDRVESEQLREYLTTKLAKVGFDQNYSPNEQGAMLERLIDKFYLR